MREVPRDDKWQSEREDNDRRRDEYEKSDAHGSTGQHLSFGDKASPTETELVTVALLMRLYDIGMGILTHLDKEKADMTYEAHENGGTLNPPIFIPSVEENED